ncbi:DUF222 domain-containing protein [Marmoricola sp. RAF53]|uniref:HNH endonuclease signature motif containing protein n=1 Tax=Marmoricola sp. RAF53 TaxID=3233059 RepID=UPI003F96C90C
MTTGTLDAATALTAARRFRAEADAAEVGLLVQAVSWANQHTVTDPDFAATWGDTPVPLAGEGAPLVSNFCVTEFSAALGMSDRSGRALIAEALEIAHRLPRVWHRITTGTLKVWRARLIASKTLHLSMDAAAYVDAQVAGFAHRIGIVETDRLVDAAIATFMPQTAREIAERRADQRHVAVDHHQVSFEGTSLIHGELDLVDALDLDARLSADAAQLKEWGSEASLDARRAEALGNLARGEMVLPGGFETGAARLPQPPVGAGRLPQPPVGAGRLPQPPVGAARLPRPPVGAERLPQPPAPRRPITLYLHLDPREPFGRLENRGPHLISQEQIQGWLQAPGAQITLRPVIDLNEELATTAYQPSDRLREQVILRDRTCVFPYCTRNARACDLDHIEPYDPDGSPDQTRTSNLAALCRHHHRLKTHAGWHYEIQRPGSYRWRSPAGYTYLRDQTATRQLTARPVDPPGERRGLPPD